jgi:hypothetical protein
MSTHFRDPSPSSNMTISRSERVTPCIPSEFATSAAATTDTSLGFLARRHGATPLVAANVPSPAIRILPHLCAPVGFSAAQEDKQHGALVGGHGCVEMARRAIYHAAAVSEPACPHGQAPRRSSEIGWECGNLRRRGERRNSFYEQVRIRVRSWITAEPWSSRVDSRSISRVSAS